MVQEELTQARLKELLDYDPETGIFTWKNPVGTRVKTNDIAGKIKKDGYRSIKVNAKDYLAHRLAWFYVTGKWPEKIIDHVNGNKLDNSIKNIRDVCYRVNNLNRPSAKGFQSVCKKFAARISYKSRTVYLGTFETAEEAHKAHQEAKEKLLSTLL